MGSNQHRQCRSCGKAPSATEPAGDEYYHHTNEYFEDLKHEFAGPVLSSKANRKKRARKPGDDEFGFQPRLSQQKKAQKRRKSKRGKGRRTKADKDGSRKIRTNAGEFLRACDESPWDPIPHSAKTRATMALVHKW